MTKRYEQLKKLFREKKCFKLVCGAGNEDVEEVRKLAIIYTLAGAHILDLSANVDVVKAAAKGIEQAYKLAEKFHKKIKMRPYLNVSIGLRGDPHVRKAQIDQAVCIQCGKCIAVCRQEAITEDFRVKQFRCIGCGDCANLCEVSAISYIHKRADFEKILPACVREGVETMELHAIIEDDESVMKDWKLLNEAIPDHFVSMCLDRQLLSNKHLVDRIREAHKITGERLIIQADGVPMSGEGDDYNTTLQAIACADVVIKSKIPVMVLLSGGTNSKTGRLAKQCGVDANGVAIGSWARKIVRQYVKRDDFDSQIKGIKKAVSVAEKLVCANIEALHGKP